MLLLTMLTRLKTVRKNIFFLITLFSAFLIIFYDFKLYLFKNTCIGAGDIFYTLGRIHLSFCSLGTNCFEVNPPEGRTRINCFAECSTYSGRNCTEHYVYVVFPTSKSLWISPLGLEETSNIINRLFIYLQLPLWNNYCWIIYFHI